MVEGSSPSAPTNFLGVNSRSTFSLNALSAVEHEPVDKPLFAQLASPHIYRRPVFFSFHIATLTRGVKGVLWVHFRQGGTSFSFFQSLHSFFSPPPPRPFKSAEP